MNLLLPYLKQNAGKIILGLTCMICVDLAQLAIPQFIKNSVDTISSGIQDHGQLTTLCILILAAGALMAVLRYCWRTLLMGTARDLEKGIRDRLFEHVLELDAPYYDRVKTGDIMAHAISDINHIRMAFGFGLMVLVDTALLGGATVIIMLYTHPKLALLAMLPMPFLILATKILGNRMHIYHKTAQESFSELTEAVREKFIGIRILKVFNFENFAIQRVDDASYDYFGKNLKRAFVSAFLKPMMGLFFNLSTLVVVLYGGYLTIHESITPGDLVAFLQYLGILSWPIIAIGWMTNLFQRGLASLKRINNLLESQPGIQNKSQTLPVPKKESDITIRHLNFSYTPGDPVLKDIDITIPAQTSIGITGPPGSGKSTLLQLLCRIYDPDSGQISIGSISSEDIELEDLRSAIALMPQESFLFSGTISENILLGKKEDPAKVKTILDVCSLTRTIEQMPHGLETIIGERGITLSGGQKQRIALARTLIQNRPILLLDDPVSQVDSQTANRIITRLKSHFSKATCAIVSHRISALADCRQIYVMDKGQILAQGSHEQLKETNLFYRQACQVQQFEETDANA